MMSERSRRVNEQTRRVNVPEDIQVSEPRQRACKHSLSEPRQRACRNMGNQLIQDYGFRLYNPAIGKFLSVDPLAPDYPWYTPYQFAGNKPINSIDLDGLEELENFSWKSNNTGKTKLSTPDYSTSFSGPTISVYEHLGLLPYKVNGFGFIEENTFSLVVRSSKDNFDVLKERYSVDPGLVHNENNYLAKYYAYENPYDDDNTLGEGDAMVINIAGPYNGAVRFTSVEVTENSFSIHAVILDDNNPLSFIPFSGASFNPSNNAPGILNLNHPDAGHITFSATFNENSSTVNYSIENTTSMGNIGTQVAQDLLGASRALQADNWLIVLDNVQNILTQSSNNVISKQHTSVGGLDRKLNTKNLPTQTE